MARKTIDSSPPLPLHYTPDFSNEDRLYQNGCQFVAGIDEAGRGPLAGPVVAAAVVLDPDNLPLGLDDSKRLTATKRAILFEIILRDALAVSVVSLCADDIDNSNIRKAALTAMQRAVASSAVNIDYALVDGRDVPPHLSCEAEALIKGDQRSVSIAAASIVAKVSRDRMMEQAGKHHPDYGFKAHAGYGTAKHRDTIETSGPIPGLHRYTFAPIKGRFIR
ncbi:ribonuclease HII [Paenochrobactrum pullorum]|uniref:ribonuclease HII n=1 Tax=Paenochrobactrum pullorum TaxID=1324351 RepID=UPI0035BC03D0